MSEIVKGIVIGVCTALVLGVISAINGQWFIGILGGVTTDELASLKSEIARSHGRLDGISLTASPAVTRDFGCGGEGVVEGTSLVAMYGSRDGTSCKVMNRNYFKTFSLTIPD